MSIRKKMTRTLVARYLEKTASPDFSEWIERGETQKNAAKPYMKRVMSALKSAGLRPRLAETTDDFRIIIPGEKRILAIPYGEAKKLRSKDSVWVISPRTKKGFGKGYDKGQIINLTDVVDMIFSGSLGKLKGYGTSYTF